MKLNSGELATDVEEDGPREFEGTIKLDKIHETLSGKIVPSEQRETMPLPCEKSNMAEILGAENTGNAVVTLSNLEENNTGSSSSSAGKHDDLADALYKCKISTDADDTLTEKISNLNLGEKQDGVDSKTWKEDDSECPEGCVAINEVISKEEADRIERENAADTTVREKGPSGGKPVNYLPNVPNYNHIAAKTYPVNVACPFVQTSSYGVAQPTIYSSMTGQPQPSPSFQQQPQQSFGKRTRSDCDEEAAKYIKPVETYNDLSDPSKSIMTCAKVVSKNTHSGGQVTYFPCDTTNSGEFDLMKLMEGNYNVGSENMCSGYPYPQNNILQNNPASMLGQEPFFEQTQLNFSSTLTECDRRRGSENRSNFSTNTDTCSEGYGSDSIASPYNESQGSPADRNMYSPPPSVDSGHGGSVAHSPGSQMDISSPRSNMTGFESNLDAYSYTSSFISPQSPAYSKPAVSSSHEFVPNLGYLPTVNGCSNYQPPVTSNVAQVPPYSASPGQPFVEANGNKDVLQKFFDLDENKEKLQVLMEVLAEDIVATGQKKSKPVKPLKGMPQNIPTPEPQLASNQQRLLTTPSPPMKKNVPVVSVPPNQIPVTQLAHSGITTTTAPMVLVQSTPVTVNPGISMAPTVINSTVPGFSQPLGTNQFLVIPARQATATPQPTTIVFVQPPQQTPVIKRVPTFKPIRPKLPSLGTESSDAKGAAGVSGKNATSPRHSHPTCQVLPVPVVQPTQSPPNPKMPAKVPKNSVKQLNIARRVVANMTKDDLLYVDSDGDTYLHVAVCRVDKYMVEALLERIVREKLLFLICKQNVEGQTPIYLAVSANQPEMVAMLIKYGVDNVGVNLMAEQMAPNGQKDIRTALHSAASNGGQYLPTLQALLRCQDCNINICNLDGYTPLHCAILEHAQTVAIRDDSQSLRLVKDSKPIIEALIKAGADPNAQDKKSGKTAFMYALETCDYNLIETLLGLIDVTKIRSYFRTQAFDGSTCMKILESRKADFPVKLYEKLTGIMSNNRNAYACRRVAENS